ncbi:peptidase C14, caspase domain-containing protein, partial [Vararia minispora EC-137]
ALLIGIDNYASADLNSLPGVVNDVNDMKSFLTGAFDSVDGFALDIKVIRNQEATAEKIRSAVESLRTNDVIKRGDPILIYYAGHGSTLPPPEGWPGHDVEIQCLVGYDAFCSERDGKYLVEGVVPDRTLAALLHRLADAKGNNITVILDCCHSGSGTR